MKAVWPSFCGQIVICGFGPWDHLRSCSLLLFLSSSPELTFPSGLAVKATLTRHRLHRKATVMVPLSPLTESRVVFFLHQGPDPTHSLMWLVQGHGLCSWSDSTLWWTERFGLWASSQTTQPWQIHREILMIRAMIISVQWRCLTHTHTCRANVHKTFQESEECEVFTLSRLCLVQWIRHRTAFRLTLIFHLCRFTADTEQEKTTFKCCMNRRHWQKHQEIVR